MLECRMCNYECGTFLEFSDHMLTTHDVDVDPQSCKVAFSREYAYTLSPSVMNHFVKGA